MAAEGSLASDSGSARTDWRACESCDLLQRLPELRDHESAECPRCGQLIERSRPDSVRKTLALASASLLLYVVAQTTTFMSFELDGLEQNARILTGMGALFADGKFPLVSLILFTAVLAPLLWTLSLLYVALPLHLGRLPGGIVPVMRFRAMMQDWSMLEVFLLAVIVTYVKLTAIANIGIGPGAWAFVALMLVSTWAGASFDPRLVWDRLGEQR
jgi:paraquat-inducible protein A